MAGLVDSKRNFQVAFTKKDSNLIDKIDLSMDEILYDNVEDFKNYDIVGMDQVVMELRKNIDDVMDMPVGSSTMYTRGNHKVMKILIIRTK